MGENCIFEEELLNKFKFYDGKNNGFVDQSDFKSVLS
jgi:Ca2+-binding EF-hand superfamily protein